MAVMRSRLSAEAQRDGKAADDRNREEREKCQLEDMAGGGARRGLSEGDSYSSRANSQSTCRLPRDGLYTDGPVP